MFFNSISSSEALSDMLTGDNQSVETGESEIRVLNNSLVGSLRKCILDDISHEVHNTFNFNPSLTWVEHRNAGRVDRIWKLLKAIKNRPDKLIGKDEWSDLCKRYERNVKAPEANGDYDNSVQAMSKSEKCKMARQANTLNHSMGRTSFDSYRYDHLQKFGTLPSIPVFWDKAYMREDPVQSVETQNTEGCIRNPEVRPISDNLHEAHSDAISSGNDENIANEKALEQVFSRTTLLNSHGARGRKRKTPTSKFSVVPTQEQFDAMKKKLEDRLKESEDKQIESDSKVAYLTGALNTVMSALEGRGLLHASIITQPEGTTSGSSDDASMD